MQPAKGRGQYLKSRTYQLPHHHQVSRPPSPSEPTASPSEPTNASLSNTADDPLLVQYYKCVKDLCRSKAQLQDFDKLHQGLLPLQSGRAHKAPPRIICGRIRNSRVSEIWEQQEEVQRLWLLCDILDLKPEPVMDTEEIFDFGCKLNQEIQERVASSLRLQSPRPEDHSWSMNMLLPKDSMPVTEMAPVSATVDPLVLCQTKDVVDDSIKATPLLLMANESVGESGIDGVVISSEPSNTTKDVANHSEEVAGILPTGEDIGARITNDRNAKDSMGEQSRDLKDREPALNPFLRDREPALNPYLRDREPALNPFLRATFIRPPQTGGVGALPQLTVYMW